MAPSLKPFKTRLTKTGNTLEELIEGSEQLLAYVPPTMDNEEEAHDMVKAKKELIHQRYTNITAAKSSMDAAISDFRGAFSRLEDRIQEEESTAEES